MESLGKCLRAFRKILKPDPDRQKHVLSMMKVATRLAGLYGCNRRKTKIACLLHDICKLEEEQALRLIIDRDFPGIDFQQFPPVTWHALGAVVYARDDCRITDQDVLNAVMYHATGRPNMSKLEKIVCLADYIEEGRTFVSDELRRLAYVDLDKAFYMSLLEVTAYLKENNLLVSSLTEAAMEYYKSK